MMSLGIDPLIDFGLSFPPRGPSDGGNSLFLHPFPSTDPQADQNQQQQQQQQQRSGAAVPTPLRTFFSQHRDNSLEVGLSALVSEAFRATTASIQQQQRGSADVATLVEAPGDGLQTMSIGGDAGGGEEERVHSPSRPSTAAAAGLGAAIAIAGGGGVPTAALDQEEGVGGSDEIGADEDGKANQWRHQDSHPPLAGRALLHQESRVARTIDREGGLTISGEDSGPPKVETIRRVMAPGFGQYGASLDVTSLADIATTTTTTTTTTTSPRMDVAKEEKHQHQHHRRNPTTAPGPPSTEDRIAAAVNAAAAYTSGKREEKVFLARQTRQEDQKPDHRAVVVVEAEEATALLKEMSIDKNVAILSSELPSSVPCQTPALGSLPESDNQ